MQRTTLKFMKQQPLDPKLMTCPYCGETQRLGVHVEAERRLICHACGRTFAETKGTVFFGLPYPVWVIVLVLTLLAYGCPLSAIVAAFYLDERTVARWHTKAGQQGQQVQAEVVGQGRVHGFLIKTECQNPTKCGKVEVNSIRRS